MWSFGTFILNSISQTRKFCSVLAYWMFNTKCSVYFCRITLLFLPKKQNKYFENLGLFLENPLTLGPLFACLNFKATVSCCHLDSSTKIQFSSVQLLSHVQLFATPWTAARQASLSITNSHSLLKLMSIESMMPSNHIFLCHPLIPPSIFPTIRVLFSGSVLCIRWPKY